MYKILKRGYYYGNAHEPEEEFLPTSYPTEEMAYMAAELSASRQHRSLISATGKTTVVQKASSLQSMKTKTISTLWFVAGMAMIIRLKAAIRLLKKTRKDVNGQFSHD